MREHLTEAAKSFKDCQNLPCASLIAKNAMFRNEQRSIIIVAHDEELQFMQSVGHFSRAYDSCLKTAEISRAQAAAAAGIHPSIVSRLLNGATQLLQDHVEALLRALPDRSDREHCVRAWLLDQCPAEFRADLIISFGSISEEKMRQPDELGQALARLDKAATHKPELKRLLAYLAELEGADPPDKTNRTTGGGPADSFSKSA